MNQGDHHPSVDFSQFKSQSDLKRRKRSSQQRLLSFGNSLIQTDNQGDSDHSMKDRSNKLGLIKIHLTKVPNFYNLRLRTKVKNTSKELIKRFKEKLDQIQIVNLGGSTTSLEVLKKAEYYTQQQYDNIREGRELHNSSIQQKEFLRNRRTHLNYIKLRPASVEDNKLQIPLDNHDNHLNATEAKTQIVKQKTQKPIERGNFNMTVLNPLHTKPPLLKNIHSMMQLKKLKKDKESSYTIKKICQSRLSESRSIPGDMTNDYINMIDNKSTEQNQILLRDQSQDSMNMLENWEDKDKQSQLSSRLREQIRQSLLSEYEYIKEQQKQEDIDRLNEIMRKTRINIKKLMEDQKEEQLFQMSQNRQKMLTLLFKKDFNGLKKQFVKPEQKKLLRLSAKSQAECKRDLAIFSTLQSSQESQEFTQDMVNTTLAQQEIQIVE
ncbi:UNKNOWN [Stylonychia lemnae]|uniref:Uncharacterized protein n=1 Tax=Stylonychia lemnae TaxID=5949 RepID=A0A078AR70_STYLE|nr:UNKNOWN [Stylonychia lemnae]|eukprot:CDW84910.1 UNKNOWN [Stylonychia lemnae]